MPHYYNGSGVPLPVAHGGDVVLVLPGEWAEMPGHEGDRHCGLTCGQVPRRLVESNGVRVLMPPLPPAEPVAPPVEPPEPEPVPRPVSEPEPVPVALPVGVEAKAEDGVEQKRSRPKKPRGSLGGTSRLHPAEE